MLRKVPFAANECFHLYSRGVERRTIFLDTKDYERFMRLLFLCNNDNTTITDRFKNLSFKELVEKLKNEKPLVALGVYCLMPNHFHLLVKEAAAGGISRFMKKLLTAYSMYFNKRHGRQGALFEGRFKSSHARSEAYINYLLSYIHLNPIKNIDPTWRDEGIRDVEQAHEYLSEYSYSSYFDFTGTERPESALLARNGGIFPESFWQHAKFVDFLDTWLSYREKSEEPLPFEALLKAGEKALEKAGIISTPVIQ
ncbi:MAG: transposase [Patescibacteria group bacterium]